MSELVGTGAADDPAAGYGWTKTFYDDLDGDGNVCVLESGQGKCWKLTK